MVKVRFHLCGVAFVFLLASSWVDAQTSVPFSMSTGASTRLVAGGFSGPLNVGFARIQPDPGRLAPDGFAIFQSRPNGILISEATTPASPLVTKADRFFVEVGGSVNTGVAIANPNPFPATITFGFQDPVVRFRAFDVGVGSFTIPPNSQIARFISEPPFNMPAPYLGLMDISSSIPVAITPLRGLTNERSEFLMTTVLQGQPARFGSVPVQPQIIAGYIPRFADGGGWNTEITLINTDGTDFSFVRLDFIAPSGQPVAVTINGQTASTFDFSIGGGDLLRIATDGTGTDTRGGYIRVIALAHSARFNGFAIYNYKKSGVTVSTSSLPMLQPGSAFRLYVDESNDTARQVQTGIAISNASSTTSSVFLELTDINGGTTRFTSAIPIPPLGQLAKFLKEIPGFETLPFPFQGVLRVTTSNPNGIVIAGIRGRLNERSDFLMASVQATVEGNSASSAEKVLPHIVQGGGYNTEVVLFNSSPGSISSGSISSISITGRPLLLSTGPMQ